MLFIQIQDKRSITRVIYILIRKRLSHY